MYSQKVQKFLKSSSIKVGDRIKIVSKGQTHEGILMPQTRLGNPDTIVIKLGSGYNAGIAFKGARISKLKSGKPLTLKTKPLKFNKSKPKISIISVGGTITSRVDYRTGGVATINHPEELLDTYPELAKFVNVHKCHTPFAKMSEDMNHKDWQILANEIAIELNHKDVKGVIVTMGTDMLHYASAALSFMLQEPGKPVIITASQRSPDRGATDAAMNLICSAHVAVSDIAEVGTVMHGSINDDYCLFIRGTHSRKMDSQRRDAFRPVNEYPLAKITHDGKVQIKNNIYRKRDNKTKVKLDTKYEPKIAILKVYPDSDPGIIDYYVSHGYKGFIIEGTGYGHVPTNGKKEWISTIKKYSNKIPFVVTLQTIYGRVNTNVYTNLRILFKEAGAISGENMLTETALVKLGWILGHTNNIHEVKEMLVKNYAGEINKRTLVGSFLY